MINVTTNACPVYEEFRYPASQQYHEVPVLFTVKGGSVSTAASISSFTQIGLGGWVVNAMLKDGNTFYACKKLEYDSSDREAVFTFDSEGGTERTVVLNADGASFGS